MADQLWCIDFLTPPTPLIIPPKLPDLPESLMPLQNWCSIHARWSKSSLKDSICFPILKQNIIAYRSSKVSTRPDCYFELHQLWQSGFSRVYSNSCCCCSFEPEIIKRDLSSHKIYSNKILNFQDYDEFKCPSQKSKNLLNAPRIFMHPCFIYLYITCKGRSQCDVCFNLYIKYWDREDKEFVCNYGYIWFKESIPFTQNLHFFLLSYKNGYRFII